MMLLEVICELVTVSQTRPSLHNIVCFKTFVAQFRAPTRYLLPISQFLDGFGPTASAPSQRRQDQLSALRFLR